MEEQTLSSEHQVPKVAVVILSYNGIKYLSKFLPGIIGTKYERFTVHLIDNASTDNTEAVIKESFPEVNLIRLKNNLGYASGYNHGLSHIEADYFVLLNQDVEVEGDWITPVIKRMEADQDMAACQPKVRSYMEKHMFEYAGGAGGMMDIFGYTYCRGRLFDKIEEDTGQYDDDSLIFWASGACMFVKAKIFTQMDGLDESFFMHMEEIDFCWRLHSAGYRVGYQHDSVVYHVGGASLPQGNPLKTYLNFRNNLMMMFKNLPLLSLIFIMPVRIGLDYIAAFKALLSGEGRTFFAIVKAHFAVMIRIPSLIGARIKARKHRKGSAIKNMYKGSIVFSFYLFGKRKASDL